jgi:hypothetical protein
MVTDMSLLTLLQRRRTRPESRARTTDWTNTMNLRDWADLPPYHPRTDRDQR